MPDKPAYVVRWLGVAAEELYTKVQADDVAEELIEVANTLLDDMNPPYGGQDPPRCWRRGLTAQRRNEVLAAEAADLDLDDGQEKPWDYVLIYRRDPRLKRLSFKPGFVVIGVVTNIELLRGLLDLDDLNGRSID